MLNSINRRIREIRWRINRDIRSTTTVNTKQGRFTIYCRDSSLSRELYCYREFELDLIVRTTNFLRQHGFALTPDGTLLDIGSNIGVISIGMLHHNIFKRAIALEPEPANFHLLQQNVRQNGMADQITCLPVAISDQPGTVNFEISEGNLGDHRVRSQADQPTAANAFNESSRQTIPVPAQSLDVLLADLPTDLVNKIQLAWMDIQGWEGYAIKGGAALFKRAIPLMTELWPYGIERSGMGTAPFCDLVARYWKQYWTFEHQALTAHPVAELPKLFEQIGYAGRYTNILLTP